MVGLMAVLLLINILIVFYVEALRENELEKFKAKFNEQQYNLQMEYYQQLKERQEEVRSLRHDVKKYILAMQAVAEHGDTEELHKIAQAATDVFERSTNISAVGNPVVDALLNYYLRIAERNNIKVNLDVTIPEVLTISSLSLSIILGNTFDNAIEACCDLPAEQRIIHLQLRKQYRSLFYRLENPYSDTSRGIRIGEYHGYGLKNINRIVQENHGDFYTKKKTSVYKGYKQDKIEMRGDRAEMSDFPLYLNTVAGGLDRRDQTIGGFSFVVKIYAVPVVEIIG